MSRRWVHIRRLDIEIGAKWSELAVQKGAVLHLVNSVTLLRSMPRLIECGSFTIEVRSLIYFRKAGVHKRGF